MSVVSSPKSLVHSDATTVVPARRWGIWWFLGSEIVTFGGLLVCFLLSRLHHTEWASEASHTLLWVGTINTIVLLTSSLTVILAHHEAHENRSGLAARYLGITILLGLLFTGFKIYEYSHEVAAGLLPSRSLFWSYYYLMTGLHMLHVLGGIVAIFFVRRGVLRGQNLERVEVAGIYWHFVDVVWIYLFPLLYVTSH